MSNEEITRAAEEKRRAIEMTVEALASLPLGEIMAAYGFALGLQAKQPAA